MIVLAEDDEKQAAGLSAVLQNAFPEWTILHVSDGRAVLEIVRKQEPDILLLDIMLPLFNGAQIWRELADQSPHLLNRIIFLTALPLGEASLALDPAPPLIFGKPVHTANLVACIEGLITLQALPPAEAGDRSGA